MRRTSPRTRRPTLLLLALLALAASAPAIAGCRKPLFSDRYQRTQYDRYDRSRNQFAQQYVEDEYGRREPNLWGRLRPKE